jgi:hypothetical protein
MLDLLATPNVWLLDNFSKIRLPDAAAVGFIIDGASPSIAMETGCRKALM